MTKKEIAKLERDIVRYAMQRLKLWKKDHPEGLLPRSQPRGIRSLPGWRLVRACLRLEAKILSGAPTDNTTETKP